MVFPVARMSLSDDAKWEAMKAAAPEVAELLRLLSTPTRLLLLCHIAQGECAVGAIERDLGIRQPGLSQQLSELRQAGLVATRRESRSIYYSIADARVRMLLGALHAIFCGEGLSTPALSPGAHPSTGNEGAARFARMLP